MHKYHFVAKGVAPKREALRLAQAELAETQKILDAARRQLQEVEDGIATLQAKFEDCMRKKEELENKCAECEARLVRADKVRTPSARPGSSAPTRYVRRVRGQARPRRQGTCAEYDGSRAHTH